MPKFALQGCIHGDLKRCYSAIESDIDAVIWAGDVQTTRDAMDLESLACPPKYRKMMDFQHFYNEREHSPCLTIFVGGNHEASAYLLQLPYGGWVAPNVYYMGFCGIISLVNAKEVPDHRITRVAGLSGIYNCSHYNSGRYEKIPFTPETIRSVYHVRKHEIQKLSCADMCNILITHDWPSDLFKYALDAESIKKDLITKKPFFKEDIDNSSLGNPASSLIAANLQPQLWVAAHLHVNFNCFIDLKKLRAEQLKDQFAEDDAVRSATLFLSHDKPKMRVATSTWDSTTSTVKCPYSSQTIKLPEASSTQQFEKELCDEQGSRTVKRMRWEKPSNLVELHVDLQWLIILRRCYTLQKQSTSRWPTPDIDIRKVRQPVLPEEWLELMTVLDEYNVKHDPWKRELSDSIPFRDLRSYTFPYPKFDHKNPDAQTAWWGNLISPACCKDTKAPSPPSSNIILPHASSSSRHVSISPPRKYKS